MKLPISLLVLAALGHAAAPQAATKGSGAKSLETKSADSKKKDTNQTNKRELFEGNYGNRKEELLPKYRTAVVNAGIEYAEELKEGHPDQSPAHQIFGARLPQIAKISDVLTGQGPSFEAAVADHLYAPVSVYQARLSSPTSFEVPAPEASLLAYPNPKTYQHHKRTEDDQKLQEPLSKEAELPRFNMKQPRTRFESYPQPLQPVFFGQPLTNPQDIFRHPQPFSRQLVSPLLSLYNPVGPIRHQGHIVPSQYIQRSHPTDPTLDYVNLEGNHVEKGSPNQESQEKFKAEPTERPQLQKQIHLAEQVYHAHPNGAISFSSFSRSLPSNTQHQTAMQTQPEKSHNQQQLQELSSQQLPLAAQFQPQKQDFFTAKPELQYEPTYQKHLLQKYQLVSPPKYHSAYQPEPQYVTVQQHLTIKDPRHILHPPTMELQFSPAFNPILISQLTSESLSQPTSTPPIAQESRPHFKPFLKPRPFGYHDLYTQQQGHTNQPLAPVSPKSNLIPLPPLKHNYNQYVKPLNPHTQTSPVFIPTPVQTLSTSTPIAEPAPDQLISSTTLQPDVKDQQESKAQSVNTETQPESQTSPPLEPEIIHQSEPTVLPLSIQSTSQKPFAAQSEHFQHSTLQPEYQSTIRPQSIQTSPRHEVIIQQQELQEFILDPSPQPSSTPHYQSHLQQTRNHQQDLEALQLQSQQHQQLLEQLQPLQYQQELPELNSQQYHDEARQLQSRQQEHKTQEINPQQYQNQQHSEPLQHQLQPQQSQTPQQTLSQEPHRSEQQQQLAEQTVSQQYQEQRDLDPQNQIQLSTPNPTQEPQEKEAEKLEFRLQPGSHPQTQYQLQFKPTAGEQHEQSEKLPASSVSTPDSGESFLNLLLSRIQPDQIYGQPQELVAHQEFGSPLGGATFPDVQYFGKYAESIFSGLQH